MTSQRPRWPLGTTIAACGWVALIVVAFMLTGTGSLTELRVLTLTCLAGLLLVFGWALLSFRRERREHEAALETWASERTATAERLRLAQDLHDLASHGLATITMRAAAARLEPAANHASALQDIETASRAATAELRRMLTVLREPGKAPTRPTESFTDLPRIIDDTDVTAQLHLEATATAGTQTLVCAIVREALRNAARYAPNSPAQIRVVRDDDQIEVTITNPMPTNPPAARTTGTGHGLQGLAERVAALGGHVHAGPMDGKWEVRARIPDPPDELGSSR